MSPNKLLGDIDNVQKGLHQEQAYLQEVLKSIEPHLEYIYYVLSKWIDHDGVWLAYPRQPRPHERTALFKNWLGKLAQEGALDHALEEIVQSKVLNEKQKERAISVARLYALLTGNMVNEKVVGLLQSGFHNNEFSVIPENMGALGRC